MGSLAESLKGQVPERSKSFKKIEIEPVREIKEDKILETCFKLNSSFASLYKKGFISYQDLIHYSIIYCYINDIYDEDIKNTLKLGLTNMFLHDSFRLDNNPFNY